MKKSIIIVWLMMCMMTAHAQLFVTPEAGMSASKPEWSDSWYSGWRAGAGVEYRFKSGVFSLKTGAYYMKRSYELPQWVILDKKTETLTQADTQSKNHFLQVPLLAKFGWKMAEGVRMHIGIGPYVAFSMKSVANVYASQIDYGKMGPDGYYNSFGRVLSYMSYSGDNPYGYYGYGANYQGVYSTASASTWDTEWGATATFGMDINKLSVNVNYDATFGEVSIIGLHSGIGLHALSLTVGYSFQLTK